MTPEEWAEAEAEFAESQGADEDEVDAVYWHALGQAEEWARLDREYIEQEYGRGDPYAYDEYESHARVLHY